MGGLFRRYVLIIASKHSQTSLEKMARDGDLSVNTLVFTDRHPLGSREGALQIR